MGASYQSWQNKRFCAWLCVCTHVCTWIEGWHILTLPYLRTVNRVGELLSLPKAKSPTLESLTLDSGTLTENATRLRLAQCPISGQSAARQDGQVIDWKSRKAELTPALKPRLSEWRWSQETRSDSRSRDTQEDPAGLTQSRPRGTAAIRWREGEVPGLQAFRRKPVGSQSQATLLPLCCHPPHRWKWASSSGSGTSELPGSRTW